MAGALYFLEIAGGTVLNLSNYKYECKNALDFCRLQPSDSIKLIVTSPPYNIGKEYETKKGINEYIEEMLPMLAEFVRVLAKDGSLCWQTGNFVDNGEVYPLDIYFYPYFKNLGMRLRNRIIWHFGHGLHCSKRFSGRYETILWFTKSDTYTFNLDDVRIPSKYPGKRYFKGEKKGQVSGNPKGKNPEDVWEMTLERLYDDWESQLWDIPNVKNNHVEKVNHPCQFPVELVERCVLALTDENDIVYDPFAGVGSSLIAALKNNRQAYGTELEQSYVDIGKERIRKLEEGNLLTRPIYQKIWVPSPNDKVAQIPKEWSAIK
ncbi:MAG: site-specific DNA-methyltransferase [Oscillospiraceae bacterium]|nr:site-specific DNA-methyltransferase [Oscillospiraceae bacterium]